MHSNRLSLFYPLLLGVYYLVQDYELTYQTISALIVGLFSLQLYRLAAIQNQKSDAKYLVAGIALFSPMLTYVGAQFPKNLLGFIGLLFLLEFLFKKQYVKVALIFLVNCFIHKMTAGLSIVLVALFLVFRLLPAYSRYLFLGGMAFLALLVVFPELLASFSFDREGFAFNQASIPSLSFIELMKESISISWTTEIVLINLLFLVILIIAIVKEETSYYWYVTFGLFILLTLPILEWSPTSLSYRLLMGFVIIGSLTLSYFRFQIRTWMKYIGFLLMIVGGVHTAIRYPSDKLDPPYNKYKVLTKKIEALGVEPELLIVHKSFAEYYTFRTGKDALPWLPEYELPTSRLWRIAYGVPVKTIYYYSGEIFDLNHKVFKISPWYSMIREDIWRSFMHNVKEDDTELYNELNTWRNPNTIRPSYLIQDKNLVK